MHLGIPICYHKSMTEPTVSRMRAWRTAKGWTLEEVAGLTGLSQGHLSRLELEQVEPSAEQRIRIARAVGAKVSDLFEPMPVQNTG